MRLLPLIAALCLGLAAAARAQPTATPAPKAAIVVANRAGAEFDSQIPVVDDFLSSRVGDLGLSVISREVVAGNLRSFDPATASAERDPSDLEASLSDSSSALRLAQNLGADYVLFTSIASFSKQKRNVNAYGVQLANYDYTLRLSYKVLDALHGGSVTGGVVTATKREQNTANSNIGFNVIPPDPSTPPAAPGSEAANADEALMRAAKKYEKAVGVVTLSSNGELIPFGTAWAVGPKTFATNSHITEDVKKLVAKGEAVYVIINKNPDLSFPVVKAVSHPRYSETRHLVNKDGRKDEAGSYDVGILEVNGNPPSWFPVASREELLRVDSGYRVAYLGFPMEERKGGGIDPRSPVATMQTGIVTAVTDWWFSAGTTESRLLVHHNLSSSGGASGSPVFNYKGEVIALHNSGTSYTGAIVQDSGKLTDSRLKSGLQINYAQRADLLADLYTPSGSGQSASAETSAHSPAPKNLVFIDPDLEPIVNDLIDDATTQITNALRVRIAQNRIPSPTKTTVALATVNIDVETADLYIPDIRIGTDKTVSIQDGQKRVAPLDVNVEIDGVAVGSAPGAIKVKPGFSRIRLTRTGYEPWERTINATDGQTLKVALRMTAEGLERWKELTAFLFTLQNGAKLTDAQVELLRGQAAALANSGFKVDIKVDTKEPITIDNSKTIVK